MSDEIRNPVERIALVGGAIVQSVNDGVDTLYNEVAEPAVGIAVVAVVVGAAGAVIGGTLAAWGVELHGMDWQTSAEVGIGVFGGAILGPMSAHGVFEEASIDSDPRKVLAKAARSYLFAAATVGLLAGASPLVTHDGERADPPVERTVAGLAAD